MILILLITAAAVVGARARKLSIDTAGLAIVADLIVLDAFSSGTIPVHLLTRGRRPPQRHVPVGDVQHEDAARGQAGEIVVANLIVGRLD